MQIIQFSGGFRCLRIFQRCNKISKQLWLVYIFLGCPKAYYTHHHHHTCTLHVAYVANRKSFRFIYRSLHTVIYASKMKTRERESVWEWERTNTLFLFVVQFSFFGISNTMNRNKFVFFEVLFWVKCSHNLYFNTFSSMTFCVQLSWLIFFLIFASSSLELVDM